MYQDLHKNVSFKVIRISELLGMGSTVDSDCEKEKVFAHLDFQDILTLEEYCNDVTIVKPKDRNAFLIGVAMTIPELGISMDLL